VKNQNRCGYTSISEGIHGSLIKSLAPVDHHSSTSLGLEKHSGPRSDSIDRTSADLKTRTDCSGKLD
jgi:hypothetical protein